jgi:segregation and condensation protein B
LKENSEESLENDINNSSEENEEEFEKTDSESEQVIGDGLLENEGEINSDVKPQENVVMDEKSLEQQVIDFNRNLVEASLYAAGRPLTIEEISTKLELTKKEVEELVNDVAFDYMERSTSLVIAQIGDRYQMQIRPEYTEKVSKFAKGGAIAERYLRTLTIIALKQPVLKSMVVKLRGSGTYEHVKYLIDNGFINAVKKGRSHELTTTDKYADMFGLPKDKSELKRAMVTQLGIEEVSSEEPHEEIEYSDENQQDIHPQNEEGNE